MEKCMEKGRVEPGYLKKRHHDCHKYLNPINEAKELLELAEIYGVQRLKVMGYGNKKTIYNKIKLLILPKVVQEWIDKSELDPSIGYLLEGINDSSAVATLAEHIKECHSSSRRARSSITASLNQGWLGPFPNRKRKWALGEIRKKVEEDENYIR